MTPMRVICVLVLESKPDLTDRLSIRDDVHVKTAAPDTDPVGSAMRDEADLILIGPSVSFTRATEICGRVRRDPRLAWVPVVLFGSRQVRNEEVNAFAAGADDYLAATVSTPALTARLHALVRRTLGRLAIGYPATNARSGTAGGNANGETIRVGQLAVKPDSYCAQIDGRSVTLSAGEFGLLWELAVYGGATVRAEQLARTGRHADGPMSSKTVRSHVAGLRRKLGGAAVQIKTVRGVGYRLVGD